MAQFDRNAAAPFGRTVSRAEAAAVDAGLRAYMLSIYNYMVLGLAITGFAALGTYMLAVTDNPADAVVRLRDGVFLTSFGQWVFVSPLKYVIMLAPLGVVFLLSARVNSMSAQSAQITFWVFAGLMGLSLASIFLVFTHTSIVRVFFITAASFGALSLYGYTTQKDLSGMASFLIMGLIGIVIASLVNIFLASSAMQFAISVIGVLVFAGLTAYDTQRLKTEYLYGGMDGFAQQKSAILGALSLYLNFINMFTMLLQLFGNRE
ncbi:Bax inhibitor-1/YccA family protein [Blastochloris viridis]|uniref:Inner membrane protein YbhL n=1 Tax=Blastochloris viridis TaxID=1079 RepID=A0A0P0JHG2_BLAVI|nr:Bax inhibitor-1/YccA family protein [Blastochloris viridis]ALK07833.1 Inner membrane protein YbhL [Blastochloris viridis]CUU43755.1 Inner membrane protein YbhL [Blastochloris viridis]